MADNQQINILIKKISERMGTPESEIKSAVSNSSYSKLLEKLPSDKARQMEEILSDEDKAKEFLNTPQAKAITEARRCPWATRRRPSSNGAQTSNELWRVPRASGSCALSGAPSTSKKNSRVSTTRPSLTTATPSCQGSFAPPFS